MSATIKRVDRCWYLVSVDGAPIGYTYSHPRCLPRSWQVRLADGSSPYNGTEVRDWWKTRKQAVAWLEALQRDCAACGSEAGEPCDMFCIARPSSGLTS